MVSLWHCPRSSSVSFDIGVAPVNAFNLIPSDHYPQGPGVFAPWPRNEAAGLDLDDGFGTARRFGLGGVVVHAPKRGLDPIGEPGRQGIWPLGEGGRGDADCLGRRGDGTSEHFDRVCFVHSADVSRLMAECKPANQFSWLNQVVMATLTQRLEEVMRAMRWEHADLVRVSGQSSSVVSQWLGKGSKEIKKIGKMDAALKIEAESGYAALWVATGQGPKHAVERRAPASDQAQAAQSDWPTVIVEGESDRALLEDIKAAINTSARWAQQIAELREDMAKQRLWYEGQAGPAGTSPDEIAKQAIRGLKQKRERTSPHGQIKKVVKAKTPMPTKKSNISGREK